MLTDLVSRGRTPSYIEASDFPVVNQRSIRWNGIDERHLKFVDPTTRQRWSPSLFLREGDVLWNSTGTGTIGRAALFQGLAEFEQVVLDSHVTLVRANHALDPQYLFALIRSPRVQDVIKDMQSGSTNQVELSRSAILATEVPLPPLAEQRRIVAKLEVLTARIAGTRKQIQYSRTLSASMRERVITSAFNGQLTSDWRRQKHSRQQETLVVTSHRSTSSIKRKIADISWRPDLQLPLGWQWASVDSVTTLCEYGTSAKSTHGEQGTPVLRMGNIQQGRIDWSSLKYLPPDVVGSSNLLLQPGDVLFNRTNSFELVGKSAVFGGYHQEVTFASYLIRLRTDGIAPEFLTFYLNSSFGRAWIKNVASQQVGQANVNGSKLKSLGIPLPPVDEQAEAVRLIEAAFARADRLEAETARAAALLDRLETFILAKAFRGELVPQDPSDEPASVLLDRIRAERAAAPKAKRGRSAAPAAED